MAMLFHRAGKYVASRGTPELSWAGSRQLGADLTGAVREIRDRHEDLKVVGSLNLVQALLLEKLFDRLTSGCTRSCWASGRRCSTAVRCP